MDRMAFPSNDPDREPAANGELEQGIAEGWTTVAAVDGRLVGFLQYDLIGDSAIDLVSLAVDPSARRQGVGSALLQNFLANIRGLDSERVISLVTSPRNVGMLALVFRHGFVATRAIRDYFGKDKDRLYCQHDAYAAQVDVESRMVIPVQAVDHIFHLLERDENVISAVRSGAQGKFFEISRLGIEDRAALRANEAAISVSESGSVLAGFTFILGLSFVIPDFSQALRVVLLLAIIATVGALAIFANASGNLARIRDNSFDLHMKWANLLLEFGGLYPFVITLAAVFAHADARTFGLSFIVCIVVAAMLAAYEYSPFSLSRRYRVTWYLHVAIILTVLLPVAYAPLTLLFGNEAPWLFAVGVVLVLRCVLHVLKGNSESRRESRARLRLRARASSPD
ncbi:MAG: N-acetyltransferase [Rhodoglobus sp.]